MLWNPQKLYRYLVASLFLLGVSACTVQLGLPASSRPNAPTVVPNASENFSDQLMLAIIQHNDSKMQQMMGDPFTLAGWQAEGSELPAPVAMLKVRNTYFTQNSAAAFHPNQDLTTLLGGQDPLALWGPAVKATEAIYTTGLGVSGQDAALLIIAQKPDGARYWFGMLVALGGFAHQPEAIPAATATMVPAAVTPTTLATPLVVAPTATPVPQAHQPQRIQFAPGAISDLISGKVQFPNRNEYLLRANAGQQMTVEMASPGNLANFAITGVNDNQPYKRLENEERTWNGPLPASQDYVISVATTGANINYKFKVTLVTP